MSYPGPRSSKTSRAYSRSMSASKSGSTAKSVSLETSWYAGRNSSRGRRYDCVVSFGGKGSASRISTSAIGAADVDTEVTLNWTVVGDLDLLLPALLRFACSELRAMRCRRRVRVGSRIPLRMRWPIDFAERMDRDGGAFSKFLRDWRTIGENKVVKRQVIFTPHVSCQIQIPNQSKQSRNLEVDRNSLFG